MKKYHINENELIKYIFENDMRYDSDKYIYNTNENAVKDSLNTLKDVAINISKRVGREVISVPLVKYFCGVAKKVLNKNSETKKLSFSIIKEIFKESMYCLKFFSKSNYSHYLTLTETSSYSWEIVMSLIMLYEGDRDNKSLGEITSRMKSLSPEDFRTYILDFYERVKSGSIYLDGKTLTERGLNSRRRSGNINANQSSGITGADINRIVNFITSPISFGVKTFNKNFNGNYSDFGKTFEQAKTISGLSPETVKVLEKIKDTVDRYETQFKALPRTKVSDIEDGMLRTTIKFPRNEMKDVSGRTITYDSVSRKYTAEKDLDFSTIMDKDPSGFPISDTLLRLKFMFLFTDLADYDADKEFVLNEILKKISVVKN